MCGIKTTMNVKIEKVKSLGHVLIHFLKTVLNF